MTLRPNTIQSALGSRKKTRRVGRGNSSGRGTYSGRGGKGQTARSGGKKRTAIRAFKASLQKVPKLRGFKSIYAKKETVTLSQLERIGVLGKDITPRYLAEKGVVGKTANGVKIVATGELKKKLVIKGCFASKTAVAAIEKAGGQIIF